MYEKESIFLQLLTFVNMDNNIYKNDRILIWTKIRDDPEWCVFA